MQAFKKKAVQGLKWTMLTAALVAAQSASAGNVFDLGVASQYGGFFFGNVNGAADSEWRLAVGGNMTAGFDIGYRNAYGSTGPSLVVGGNLTYGNGVLFNGPNYNTNTNASIGPAAAEWIGAGKVTYGTAVYGGTLSLINSNGGNNNWQSGQFSQANLIDFGGAKTQLSSLSTQLAGKAANGTVTVENQGLTLTGDKTSMLQVFNLGNNGNISTITLADVNPNATIIINSSASNVTFSGNLGGNLQTDTSGLAGYRDRLLFNLSNASTANINTFVNGSILAVGATVQGTGHIEGTTIANNLSTDLGKVELGYEPFQATAPVPEPQTYAMMIAGLLAIGSLARRRNKQQ